MSAELWHGPTVSATRPGQLSDGADQSLFRRDESRVRRGLGRGQGPVAALLALLGFAAALRAADKTPAGLTGRWRSLETSRGGIGSMITFLEGGALEFSPGAVVEIPYRIEGDQLILPGGSKDASESRQKIVWLADDKLRLDTESGPGIELTRAGARESASEPILGEWQGKREMAGQELSILYFFRREGRSLLLIPFVTQTGRYTTDKSHVHLEWPNCPIPEAEFAVDSDVLTLTADGKKSRYARY
jgi:hypothetical protein